MTSDSEMSEMVWLPRGRTFHLAAQTHTSVSPLITSLHWLMMWIYVENWQVNLHCFDFTSISGAQCLLLWCFCTSDHVGHLHLRVSAGGSQFYYKYDIKMVCDEGIHILRSKSGPNSPLCFVWLDSLFRKLLSQYSSDTGLHWEASFLSTEAQTHPAIEMASHTCEGVISDYLSQLQRVIKTTKYNWWGPTVVLKHDDNQTSANIMLQTPKC